jgi:hypothetical protein
MLQLRTTRIFKSLFEDLASGVAIQEEGVALAFVKEGGDTKVRPSTGAAGEVFAGFALARNMPPASVPLVEQGTSAATGSLTRAPIPGQAFISVGGKALTITADAADLDDDHILIVGSAYQLTVANQGKSMYAQYLYTPSTLEARQILGDAPYGGRGCG